MRLASVRSLSQLATGRATVAVKAVDFLADMFNDEIESIRLESIQCIRPLVKYCPLTEDQTETMLNVLDVSFVMTHTHSIHVEGRLYSLYSLKYIDLSRAFAIKPCITPIASSITATSPEGKTMNLYDRLNKNF